jgi:transcriptional regulator with PAS, ATPase and Fis domain
MMKQKDQQVNSEGMLSVGIIGNVGPIQEILNKAKRSYCIQSKFIQLKSRNIDRVDISLLFINTQNFDFNEDIRPLLNKLSQKSTRVFIICDKFDSTIASEVWLQYPCVIGYELSTRLDEQSILEVIGELAENLTPATASDDEQIEVGSRFPLQVEEYSRRKFVSLFIGAPRKLLLELRQIIAFVREFNNLPCVGNHLFKSKSPNIWFNEIVDKVKKSGQLPEPLEKLRKEREEKSPFAPHILLLGETGTGKTLLARFIHHQIYSGLIEQEEDWDFVDSLFQDLNCSAFPPTLIDGQLFGYLAGAFTDARENYPGRIFLACHGTVFLDEIGDMPLQAQAKLLKFLDDGGFYPLNWPGTTKLYIPTTIIAATNQPVERLLEEGRFRRDLYERFRHKIRMPSLRERREHFDALVDFVLQNPAINPIINEKQKKRKIRAISASALNRLREYDYPGNFRELESILWKAVQNAEAEMRDVILPRHIELPKKTTSS